MEYLNLNTESSIIHEGALHSGSGVFLNCDVQCVCSLWLLFSQQNTEQQRVNDICFHVTVLIIVMWLVQ